MKNSRERKDGKDERKKSIANHVSSLYGSRKPARYLLGGVLKAQAASIGKNLEGTDGTVSGNDALTPSEGQNTGETEEGKLTVPQNLRVEGDFIVWDEVKDAYGYRLRTTINGEEVSKDYCYYDPGEKPKVEIDRFFIEQQYPNRSFTSSGSIGIRGFPIIDFGDYAFEVCALDGGKTPTEYSVPVTVSYKAAFESPENVGFDESGDRVQWDVVEGASWYHICVFEDDARRTLLQINYGTYTSQSLEYFLGNNTSGNYWISVQAMDGDYHVSEWTEPMAVSYTKKEKIRRKVPEIFRLDERGNLQWDVVEGADYYSVSVTNAGYRTEFHSGNGSETRCDNWKTMLCPYDDESTIRIQVKAGSNNIEESPWSVSFTPSFKPQHNGAIPVPENLWLEDGYLRWDTDDCSCYWPRIWANETLLQDSYRMTNDHYHIGNQMPAGSYEVELFIVDENGNYNNKKYPVTLDTVPDETVWIPKIYYKFETLLWDYDHLRHDKTRNFWIRLREKDNVVRLQKSYSEYFNGLRDLSNGEYTVDVCVYESGNKLGNWSTPLQISKHDNGLFDKENESTTDVEFPPEAVDVPVEDRITSITINPAFNMKNKTDQNVELDLSKIKVKAKAIYDEEGLKRASEALGKPISGNTHYNLLDLTLLYNGEDFSNGYEGLVQVIIPLPAGHKDKTFSCYRLTEIDGVMTKELIPGEQTEDSYIIYLEHFSKYALVQDGDEESHTHAYGAGWESDENSHWKECDCKATSEEAAHDFGDWNITKEATENADGMKERSCQVCGFKQTAAVPGLSHIHAYSTSWKSDGNSHWKECDCKATSEVAPHDFGDWNITKEATEDAEGMKERSCSVCGFKQTEKMSKLSLQDDEEEDDAEDDTESAGTKAEQLGARSPKTDGDTLFERYMALAMIIGFACLSLYFMLNIKWAKEP